MKFSIDKEKAIELAKQLNIKVSFDNEKPGVNVIKEDGVQTFDFEEFFPELETFFPDSEKIESNYVTRDRDVFWSKTPVKQHSKKVSITQSQTSITISSSQMLVGAA